MVRLKHRYLIGQIFDDPGKLESAIITNSKDLQSSLIENIKFLYGEVGMGSFGANIQVKFYDPTTRIYLVRVFREHALSLQFALTCTTSLKKNDNVTLKTLALSGSSRTCKTTLISILTSTVDVLEISLAEKDLLRKSYLIQIRNLDI